MAGGILADFVCMRQFWKLALNDWTRAGSYRQVTSKLRVVVGLGGLLLLVGGMTMIVLVERAGPVKPQLWFQIKMILVLQLILNVIFLGARQAGKLSKLLKLSLNEPPIGKLKRIRSRLNFFYVFQLLLILAIFVLSAFRFN